MLAGPSRARVTARFAQLRDAYDDFDVRQTTLSVTPDEYERALAEFGDVARVDVRVRNDEGEVLAVPDGEEWREPGTGVGASEPIADVACETVRERTGVQPVVAGLDRAAIVCINVEDPDREPVYRLHVRLLADAADGTPTGPASWRGEPPETNWF
jgi:ADP-ribose pyrophosphatase YjhB (NUDIX family)